jgi:sarcosine oxidase subunit alpha
LVQRLEMDIDLSRETCPHLSIRSGMLKDIPVRVARVGFTGELSFEINTPSGYTPALWDSLLSYGVEWNARAIGVDALQELRIEKGFLHVGSDTDGRTIPADIGMGGVLSKKTQDFVGRRSLDRPDAKRADRLQFTGIAAEEPDVVLPIGAHIVASSKGRSESEGYVTSSCASETLARGVSLGLVRAAQSRMGESIHVYFEGRVWPARIVPPCQYDPKGQRLNA